MKVLESEFAQGFIRMADDGWQLRYHERNGGNLSYRIRHGEIAEASAKLMEDHNAVVWAHHGLFAAGEDFDIAFGLFHTIEKSAEILLKVMSVTDKKRQTIQPDDFRSLAEAFGVKLPEKYLYEKNEVF